MILSKFELFRVQLRCHKPFRIATGVSDTCRTIVVRLTTDKGVSGFGEAVPKPVLTGETLEGCEATLNNLLWPTICDRPVWAVNELDAAMQAVAPGSPSARAAMNMAVNDILGKAVQQPLFRMLGGSRSSVSTNMSIGLCSLEETAAEAKRIVSEGYAAIKLKVGLDPEDDCARVRATREAVGPDIYLRLDANEGWNYTQALQALSMMEPYDVELIEQPLPRWNHTDMARLRERICIPLIADESVRTPHDAIALVRAQSAVGFNIKLMKCGGIQQAAQIAAIARAAGMSLMVGGMVGESSISVSAAASLAAAYSFEYCDLDADMLLRDQLCPDSGLSQGPLRELNPALHGLGIPSIADIFLDAPINVNSRGFSIDHWANT